jgi:Tetratricopeptide repeat/Dolichyl-phosphate-mannose-protein mannosyltransferase
MDMKRIWIPAIVCAVLAAVIRLFALIAFEQSVLFEPSATSVHDRSLYIQAIQQVEAGQFWPDGSFDYMPLYPWVMGGISTVFGFSLKLAATTGILVDFFTTMLIVLLARRLGAHIMLASIAGLIYAAYPLAVIYSLMTMPNSLNALGVTAFVFAAQGLYDKPKAWAGLFLGILAGVVALGFAGMLLMAAAVALVLTITSRSIPFMFLFIAGMILPILPVAMHNTKSEGQFVLLTTHGGLNLYMGNHREATGYPLRIKNFRMSAQTMLEDARRFAEQETGRTLSKAESSAWWRDQARAFWRERPAHTFLLTTKKLILFWNFRDVDDMRILEQLRITDPPFRQLVGTPYAVFSMLGVIGLVFTRRAPVIRIALLAGMIGLVLFFITARYRLTFVPVMAGFGVAGVGHMWDDWKNFRFTRTILLLPLFAAILFPFYLRDQRPVDHYNAAIQLMSRERNAEAMNVVERGIAIDPNSADLFFAKGNLLFNDGKFTEAAEAFSQSLVRNPGNPTAVFNHALSLARKGDYCGARDALLRMQQLRMPIDERTESLFQELNAACDSVVE